MEWTWRHPNRELGSWEASANLGLLLTGSTEIKTKAPWIWALLPGTGHSRLQVCQVQYKYIDVIHHSLKKGTLRGLRGNFFQEHLEELLPKLPSCRPLDLVAFGPPGALSSELHQLFTQGIACGSFSQLYTNWKCHCRTECQVKKMYAFTRKRIIPEILESVFPTKCNVCS